MADIRTTLVLDDKQFQQAINRAEDSVEDFGDTIERESSTATNALKGLGQAIAGLGFAQLITNTFNFGAQLTNMSNATGIAIANIKGLSDAFIDAGGTSDRAYDALNDLVKNMGDAKQNGGELLVAFNQLGIGLNELSTLSEQDILRKTIEGLARIPDAATRSATGMKLMGEAIKGVDLTKVNETLGEFTRQSAGVDASARAAAQAQSNFAGAYGELQTQLLAALQPLSELAASITANKEAIRDVIDLLISLAKIFGTLFIVNQLVGALAHFNKILFAARLAGTGLVGALGKITGVTGLLVPGITSVGKAFGVFTGHTLASKTAAGKLNSFLGLLSIGFSKLIPFVGGAFVAFEALNFVVKRLSDDASGIWDWIQKGAKALGLISETSKEAEARIAAMDAEIDKATAEFEELTRQAEANAQATLAQAGALKNLKAELDNVVNAYKASNAEIISRIKLETDLIGKSEEQIQLENALADARKSNADQVRQLEEKLNSVTDPALKAEYAAAIARVNDEYKEQQMQLMIALDAQREKNRENQISIFQSDQLIASQERLRDIQSQIARLDMSNLQKQYVDLETAATRSAEAAIQAEEKRRGARLSPEEEAAYYAAARKGLEDLKRATDELAAAEAKRRQNQAFLKEQIDANKEIQKIQEDIAKLTMTEMEKKEYDIAKAARERAEAMIAAEEAARGAALSAEERAAYEREANKSVQETIELARKYEDTSRSWATGWKQAMNDYVRAATDGATKAKNIFGKAMKGMEDLIVDFAKTGKFQWKNFLAMMLEELLRAQIQAIFAGMIGDMQGSLKGSAGGGLSNLLGGGGSGKGSSSSGFWDTASNVIGGIGNLFGNPLTASTYGTKAGSQQTRMLAEQDAAFGSSSVWEGIKSVGSSVVGVISDIGSSIGNLFSGWFAEGGRIPSGKFGIAGEAGPELIKGPADVIPAAQLGGGSGVTNVNYTIHAVDAASFKQLLAQDPGYLYGLTMMGARGVPSRR
jgi:lambda family phage tail tape measure protein